MPPTTFIYALCEPGTRTVRYIGKTNNLKQRLIAHIGQSSKRKTHLGNWLRGLLLRDERPNQILLRVVDDKTWQEWETLYIKSARALGMRLVNASDGGEGGINPTSETRSKIGAASKGRVASPETRAKQSASRRGAKNHNFGRPLPVHVRSAALRANVGSRASTEKRQKMSASQTASWEKNPDRKESVSAAVKDVWKNPEYKAKTSLAISAALSTPESRARRALQTGEKNPNFGKTASEETRAKQSAAKKGGSWSPARRAAFERGRGEGS